MYINLKNIIISVVVIVFVMLSFNILYNVNRNQYLKKVIKCDTNYILLDYPTFNTIENILNKYVDAIKNENYKMLESVSIFNAKHLDYNELNNKINNYVVTLQKVYILDEDIYKCIVYIHNIEFSLVLKLDTVNEYYKVLEFKEV